MALAVSSCGWRRRSPSLRPHKMVSFHSASCLSRLGSRDMQHRLLPMDGGSARLPYKEAQDRAWNRIEGRALAKETEISFK